MSHIYRDITTERILGNTDYSSNTWGDTGNTGLSQPTSVMLQDLERWGLVPVPLPHPALSREHW